MSDQEEPAVEYPAEPRPFRYDGEVDPGEKRHLRYEVGETYHGDSGSPVTRWKVGSRRRGARSRSR